jgi:hypothetical protein
MTFLKLDMSLSSGEGKETQTLLGPLESANLSHRTCSFLGTQRSRCLLHLTRETSRFRLVVFSSYLEFQTINKFQKPSDTECYTIVRTL